MAMLYACGSRHASYLVAVHVLSSYLVLNGCIVETFGLKGGGTHLYHMTLTCTYLD